MLATLMIEPPPPTRIAGIAACMPSSVPVALTASSRFQLCSVSSSSGLTWMIPALLTSTSRRPCDGGRPVVGIGDVEVAIGHVEAVGAQPGGGLLAGVVEHVAGDHGRAFAREPLGVRGTLAARAAGDQGHPAREPAHSVTLAGRAARSSALWASRSCRFQSARTMSIRASGTSISAKCDASAERRAGSSLSMRTTSSAWAE